MKNLKLKNGSEAPDVLVASVMVSLRDLWDTKPIVAFEFVSLCRDPKHELWSGKADLERANLIKDGKVHDSIRDIVLSAVSGEGLSMTIDAPVPQ